MATSKAPFALGDDQGSKEARAPRVSMARARRQREERRPPSRPRSAFPVHVGAAAHRAEQHADAEPFTTGQNVFFEAGQLHPGTAEGDRLLGRELAHAIAGSASMIHRTWKRHRVDRGKHLATWISERGAHHKKLERTHGLVHRQEHGGNGWDSIRPAPLVPFEGVPPFLLVAPRAPGKQVSTPRPGEEVKRLGRPTGGGSGSDTAGLDRARAYLQHLNQETFERTRIAMAYPFPEDRHAYDSSTLPGKTNGHGFTFARSMGTWKEGEEVCDLVRESTEPITVFMKKGAVAHTGRRTGDTLTHFLIGVGICQTDISKGAKLGYEERYDLPGELSHFEERLAAIAAAKRAAEERERATRPIAPVWVRYREALNALKYARESAGDEDDTAEVTRLDDLMTARVRELDVIAYQIQGLERTASGDECAAMEELIPVLTGALGT